MEIPSRRIECDVLIIGGGAAALVAALEARKSLERVVVVSKRKPGRSGNTIVAGAGFCVCIPEEGNPDSVEQHLADTLSTGEGINDPELVRTLITEGPEAVMGLEQYGVRFARADGTLVRRRNPGHSQPRQIPTVLTGFHHATRGLSITLPLLKAVEERGITLLSDLPVHRLLVRDGTVCGALAVDAHTAEPVVFVAKSVILAAGGGGYLFANTDNTQDMTGDSYAMALEAGVPLRDMEFVQYYPSFMIWPFHLGASSGMFGEGAVLRNRHGERFMTRYDPVNADMATRDKMSISIFQEVQAGNGVQGGVYMDCSAVPARVLEVKFPTLLKLMRTRSIDLSREWLIVGPATHFIMGGAWIDIRCRTAVEGLFATGEASGGVHGANRLAGNALTETVVYGLRAAREAVRYVGASGRLPEPPRTLPDLPSLQDGTVDLTEVKDELRRAMWDGVSIVRTQSGLRQAHSVLDQCREALTRCRVAEPSDVASYLELERMVEVGQSIIAASLERKESRGGHYRADCPDRDDSRWLGSTRVEKVGDGLKTSFVPIS